MDNTQERTDIVHYRNGEGNGLLPFAIYLAAAAIFLLAASLQGISHFDIGIYLSGYQHFNEDPYTTYYLGQWYLTYHFCSAVCNLLGIDTLFGLRMMRVAMLLAMQTIIYLYLRKMIRTKYIIAGLAMMMLAQYGAYSEINYNDLSIFMLVCAILSYHRGLHSDRRQATYIALAGLLTGISFFLRLVNLTFILLPLYAMLVSKYNGIRMCWWKHLLPFLAGVAAGCTAVFCTAWADGTSGVLQLTAADLFSMSGDCNDPHSIMSVTRHYLEDILDEIKMALFMAFVMYGFILANMQVGRRMLHAAFSILAAMIVIVVWQDGISANTTVGFCLAAFLLDIYGRKKMPYRDTPQNRQPSSLIALAMFIPLVFPIGSNGTSQFYGQCLCILAMPLAVSVIARGEEMPSLRNTAISVRYIVVSVCVGLTVTNIVRPMMEDGNRFDCLHTIDSKATRHLFTNKENADLHNRMIKEVKPMIPRGSHLICNFSITMISVLECKPYGVFTDVFSTQSMTERYLYVAHERGVEGKKLPYLLIDESQETEGFRHVRDILSAMSPYEEVWRSKNYVLLKPNG